MEKLLNFYFLLHRLRWEEGYKARELALCLGIDFGYTSLLLSLKDLK